MPNCTLEMHESFVERSNGRLATRNLFLCSPYLIYLLKFFQQRVTDHRGRHLFKSVQIFPSHAAGQVVHVWQYCALEVWGRELNGTSHVCNTTAPYIILTLSHTLPFIIIFSKALSCIFTLYHSNCAVTNYIEITLFSIIHSSECDKLFDRIFFIITVYNVLH